MKLLEAAGVMCVAILHASSNTHTRTYMPHTGSLSLACLFFFFLAKVRWLYICLCLDISEYQSLFSLACALSVLLSLCEATCRSLA